MVVVMGFSPAVDDSHDTVLLDDDGQPLVERLLDERLRVVTSVAVSTPSSATSRTRSPA